MALRQGGQKQAGMRKSLLGSRYNAVRWTPFTGQFGGLDKLGPGYPYAANLHPTGSPAWASAGVRPPRAEWGRSAL